MEHYQAITKNEIMPSAATRMQLEILILGDVNQKEKKPIPYDITYIWNIKYGTNEPIYREEQTHRHGCQGGSKSRGRLRAYGAGTSAMMGRAFG